MRRFLAVAMALAAVGCDQPSRDGQQARMASLEARVVAIERAQDAQQKLATTGRWILWSQGYPSVGREAPIPAEAFDSQADCIARLDSTVKASGGTGQSYMIAGANLSYELSCLPQGTEPRNPLQ